MSRIITLLASMALAGCVVSTDNFASVEQADGIMPNGVSANGIMPNGIMPNDVRLNGIMPNGIMPNGTVIGVAGTGAPLSGADLVGSQWTGQLSDGSTLAIRIDEAAAPTSANGDLWSYRFSALVSNEWRALCVTAAGAPAFADTVGGTWNLQEGVPGGGSYHPDTEQFTIACRGSAIAKCVELGYKPWNGIVTELASCVRALRADYCGDGTPHTVNGTLINLYDNLGIQTDTVAWAAEAEWTPDGATCVSTKKATRFDQVTDERPSCYPRALKPEKSCGTGFSGGAAIITELAPR